MQAEAQAFPADGGGKVHGHIQEEAAVFRFPGWLPQEETAIVGMEEGDGLGGGQVAEGARGVLLEPGLVQGLDQGQGALVEEGGILGEEVHPQGINAQPQALADHMLAHPQGIPRGA